MGWDLEKYGCPREYRTSLLVIMKGEGTYLMYRNQKNRNTSQRDSGHLFSRVGHIHLPDQEYDCSNRTVRWWGIG